MQYCAFEQITEGKITSLLLREETCEGLQKQETTCKEVKENIKKSQDYIRKRKQERGHEDGF